MPAQCATIVDPLSRDLPNGVDLTTPSPSNLLLAIASGNWTLAEQMSTILPRLDVIRTWQGGESAPQLSAALKAGRVNLSARLLSLYPDCKRAAIAAMSDLTHSKEPATHAAASVDFLVDAGLDPNNRNLRNTPPLEAALTHGQPALAVALLDRGARFDGFTYPARKLVRCVFASRQANDAHALVFSPAGWELLDLAVNQGLILPDLVKTKWNAFHFHGFNPLRCQVAKLDTARLLSLCENQQLQRQTPSAPSPSTGPARL